MIILVAIFALVALPLAAAEPQTETVRGTVLYYLPWQFFLLKTEDRVVRVQTKQGAPELSSGDLVEARGVPARRNGRITVEAARYEKNGENGVVPETQLIGPKDFPRVFDEGKPSDLYGMPVRLKARVLKIIPREWAFTDFDIECGGEIITASICGYLDDELAELLALHPDVELEGFLIFLDIDFPIGEIPKIDLRLPDSDAITIIPNTAFRRRLLAHKVSKAARYAPWLLILVVAALSFKLYRAHQSKSRLQAVIAERRRMAADLHDSIEQHLAGARLYLDSMLSEDGSPVPENLMPIKLARDILVTAKREIRDTVWNLRIDELMQKRPKDVLISLSKKLATTTALRVDVRLKRLPDTLPEAQFSNMLFIVQEAVTNAVKHGKATRILIASDTLGAKKFALKIVNNGTSFDPERTLGPEAGHFGLSGMRERARRCGFVVSFASRRLTTSVRMEIQL